MGLDILESIIEFEFWGSLKEVVMVTGSLCMGEVGGVTDTLFNWQSKSCLVGARGVESLSNKSVRSLTSHLQKIERQHVTLCLFTVH